MAMRLLVDTNVLLELILGRIKANEVRRFFEIVDQEHHQALISSSSLCTISYYVEARLKELGIHKPDKTERSRAILNDILRLVSIADITQMEALAGINDPDFDDFEDSLQYQCAKRANCQAIITFNVKDYKNVKDAGLSILQPQDFNNRE